MTISRRCVWKGAQQKKNENTTAADEHFYLFMLQHISFIYCIKLYGENSTAAKEVDHFVGLVWSYIKKSISGLRGCVGENETI